MNLGIDPYETGLKVGRFLGLSRGRRSGFRKGHETGVQEAFAGAGLTSRPRRRKTMAKRRGGKRRGGRRGRKGGKIPGIGRAAVLVRGKMPTAIRAHCRKLKNTRVLYHGRVIRVTKQCSYGGGGKRRRKGGKKRRRRGRKSRRRGKKRREEY